MYLFLAQANAAIVVATGAGADLASRILMAILSLFIHINPRIAYMAAAVGVILVRTFGMFSPEEKIVNLINFFHISFSIFERY